MRKWNQMGRGGGGEEEVGRGQRPVGDRWDGDDVQMGPSKGRGMEQMNKRRRN